MVDLTQIETGTTKKFIEDLNDNFEKIRNQFDTANNFIFAEGQHKQVAAPGLIGPSGSAGIGEEITWFYRLHTNGTAECWCTCGMVLEKGAWNHWGDNNLYYNTCCANPDGLTQLHYPKMLDIGKLDSNLKNIIEIENYLADVNLASGNDCLSKIFWDTVKPKCFVSVNSITGAAMLFTTTRPETEKNSPDAVYKFAPQVQAVYYSDLPVDRTITVNYYVIGRWKE